MINLTLINATRSWCLVIVGSWYRQPTKGCMWQRGVKVTGTNTSKPCSQVSSEIPARRNFSDNQQWSFFFKHSSQASLHKTQLNCRTSSKDFIHARCCFLCWLNGFFVDRQSFVYVSQLLSQFAAMLSDMKSLALFTILICNTYQNNSNCGFSFTTLK